MQPADKIGLYRSLFRGRDDAFAGRWDKNGSYFPDYTFDWNEFNLHKANGGVIKNFQNKQLTPLTNEVIRKHLVGQITVGIYPMLEDNTSYFLAADFDKEHWLEDCRSYQRQIAKFEPLGYIEQSRSGNGGRVWAFFEGKLTQYADRLMHSSKPKVLIDYRDKQIAFLDRQFKRRARVYKKL